MAIETLERRFAAVGARLKVAKGPWRGEPRIDIRTDARGEYFDLRFAGGEPSVGLEVVDFQPHDRHLLLLAREGVEKSKFLCGHDERHWFVAAVPEAARGVSGVAAAKAALQPQAVRERVERRATEGPVSAAQRGVRPPGRVVLRAGGRARPARRDSRCATSRSRGAAVSRTCCSSPIAAAATSFTSTTTIRRDQRGTLRPAAPGQQRSGQLMRMCATPRCTRRARSAIRTTPQFTLPAGTAC